MPDKRLLREGLAILSNCQQQTGDIWHAHYGAAAIAAYRIVKENKLSPETVNEMLFQCAAMLEKHRLNEGHAASSPMIDCESAERIIVEALATTIDQLHWVGHNVIYSSHALLALRELNGWGTINDINNMATLIRSFEKTIPGRSWLGFSASEVKRLEIVAEDRIPPIETASQLSEFVLQELAETGTIYRAESHHDLLGHMLTFSHALNVLYDLGYTDLFRRGLFPLLQLVKALRRSRQWIPGEPINLVSPVDILPLAESAPASHSPLELRFWLEEHASHDWDYGHHFKFTHSYYNHVGRASQFASSTLTKFLQIIGSCER